MLKYKHMRLDQEKIKRAKKILKAKTDTEAIDQALDMVINGAKDSLKRKKIVKYMLQLRSKIGKTKEDPAEWVRLARKERTGIHDRSA